MSTEVNSKNIFETENGQVERASKELEAAFLSFEKKRKTPKKRMVKSSELSNETKIII